MTNILLAIFLTSAVPSFEAQTLDGRTVTGPLLELSADRATVLTAGGRVSLETGKLLKISQKVEARPGPRPAAVAVELVDGALIQAAQYIVRGSQAQITLAGGEIVEAPTSAVRTVQFQPSAEFSPEWSRLLEAKADSDLLIVRTGGGIDAHKGVLHDVTEDAVRFDLDGDILPVRRSKVYGLAYRHSVAAELPPATCRITDSAGSQWPVRSLTLAEKLQWLTPAGVAVSQPLENVAEIDFSGGKLVYLSDLKPESSLLDAVLRRREAAAGGASGSTPRASTAASIRPGWSWRASATPRAWRYTPTPNSSIGCRPVSAALPPRPASTRPRGPAARSGWSSAATTSRCGKAKSPATRRPRRSKWTSQVCGV